MQALGPSLTPRESPLLHLDTEDEEEERPVPAPRAVAPRVLGVSPPHATLLLDQPRAPADLASKFRLIELRGSDVSANQVSTALIVLI